jgi:hypothetical protein
MTAHFPDTGRSAHIDISALIEFSHAFDPSMAAEAPTLLTQFLLTLAPALWLRRMRRLQEA